MKKQVLWSNETHELDKIVEGLREEYPNEDDSYVCSMADSYLEAYHGDLIAQLGDQRANGRIIAIADLGLWNKRVMGYKEIGNLLANIFYSNDDYCSWLIDGEELLYKGLHHDGSNYIRFRTFKEELGDEAYEDLLESIYLSKVTDEMIDQLTDPLGNVIRELVL